jgi:hypothetical protein
MNLRHEILLDLFHRMADHIDAGMDPDAALAAAAEDMKQALRAIVARAGTRAAYRATGLKMLH